MTVHLQCIKRSFFYLTFKKSIFLMHFSIGLGGFTWSNRRSIIWSRDRWLSVRNFFLKSFYVPKTLNAFFSKQRFCAQHARFLKKFSTDYFQIFYVYSKNKYLWRDEAVFEIFNFIIIKLTKKVDFCIFLNYRHFVILKNKKNLLRHFRSMVILIKKKFYLFVSDDADWGNRACHGHAFF